MTVVQAVIELVLTPLTKLGFKRRTNLIFTIDLEEGVIGWLGLNRATAGRPVGEAEINPVVGVRHQDIERLVAELCGEKFHKYNPPTISTPLGYLLPESRYRAWVLTRDRGDVVATDMVTAIATHGLPFMRSVTGLKELCVQLDAFQGIEHQLVYRRPTAWLALGDRKRAAASLDKSLAILRDRKDPFAEDYRRFAAAFRKRFYGA